MLLDNKEIDRLTEEWLNADEDVDWAQMLLKAQLKNIMDMLQSCKGELISRNNEPFIATFEMLLSDYEALLEEVSE